VSTKSDIIQRLEREILPLQGFKPPKGGEAPDFGLGPMHAAFPNGSFPTGAVHELVSSTSEGAAASVGFMGGLLGTLMRGGGAMLWIGHGKKVFPMALKSFGIEPDRVVFVELSRPKDMLWVMEEALKCEGLAAVVGEIPEIGFTASRRLQLAVEQSRVTGFLLRHQPRGLGVNACVARWRVSALASETDAGLPGVGFPRWNVELLKIRNGRPGVWPLEWAAGRFRAVPSPMIGAGIAAVPMVGATPMIAAMVGESHGPWVGSALGAATISEQKRKAG
jgi:protein ImuA